MLVQGLPVFLLGVIYPSRKIVAWAARTWAHSMLGISGARLTIEGAAGLDDGRPRFFVGNHQSALDIPIIVAALGGDVRFMAKKSLFYIPIFGWVLSRYGFVPVDRTNARKAHGKLEQMIERLRKSPISFAAFPEGTRSRDGSLQPFRKGTLKICQRSGLPVVPFSIEGTLVVHHRDAFFHAYPGPVRLKFGKPITAEEIAEMAPGELYDRVRMTVARQLGQPVELTDPATATLVATETS